MNGPSRMPRLSVYSFLIFLSVAVLLIAGVSLISNAFFGTVVNGGLYPSLIVLSSAILLCYLGHRYLRQVEHLRSETAEVKRDHLKAQDTLNAILLERSDGAIIWADNSLKTAAGNAQDLLQLEERDDVEVISHNLVRTDHSARLKELMDRLFEDGIAFEENFAGPKDEQRTISGLTLGSEALVTVNDAKTEREFLPRMSDRLLSAEQRALTLEEGFDCAPIYAWRRDSTGRLDWMNSLFVQAVEAPAIDVAISCQIELLSGPDAEKPKQLAERARRDQKPQVERLKTIIGGESCSLEFHEVPYKSGTLGFAIDVTKQVAASAALNMQMRANEETLDRLHRGVAVFSNDLRLTYANETANDIWRLDRAWLETHPSLREILNNLREINRVPQVRSFPVWRDEFLQACKNRDDSVARQWHLADGTALRVIVQAHPMGGVMLLLEDVTDYYALQRDAATVSAVYLSTFSRLTEGIIVFGLDGRCRIGNTAFREIWNLAAEDVEGEHITEISKKCTPLYNNKAIWTRALGQISAASESREVWQETLIRKDGSVLSMASAPLPDGATMFAFSDITDSFYKERVLREQNEQLEEILMLRGQFLKSIHGASHELKIPLNTIVGFSEILSQEMYGDLNTRQHEYVDGISQASNDLRQLISGIIDLAMLQSDYFAFRIESIEVQPMLNSIAEFVKRNTPGPQKIDIDCASSIGEIPGDASRFREIIHTLLIAIRAGIENEDSIEIGARRDGDKLRVWVGAFKEPIPSHIRDIFARNDLGDSMPDLRRTELGITLVRQFVERQGGSISFQDGIGQTLEAIVFNFCTDADEVRAAINREREIAPPHAAE